MSYRNKAYKYRIFSCIWFFLKNGRQSKKDQIQGDVSKRMLLIACLLSVPFFKTLFKVPYSTPLPHFCQFCTFMLCCFYSVLNGM